MRIATGIIAGLIVLLLSAFLMPTSAMIASNGSVGTILVVSDIPVGADVFITVNDGIPIFARAGQDGIVKYLPLVEGALKIEVKKDGNIIDSKILSIGPKTVSRPSSGGGGGGSSGGTYPTVTPTPKKNGTNVNESIPLDEATSEPTVAVTYQVPDTTVTVKKTKKVTEESPGFGIIAAIGTISMLYVLRRNK